MKITRFEDIEAWQEARRLVSQVYDAIKRNKEFNHPIIGKWNWVESFGGIGGVRLTPESEGYTKTHVYSPDSTFLGFRNDSLMIVAKYSITRKLVWYKYMAEVLQVGEQIEQIIEFWGNDTLGLGDHVVDGFGHLFVRIKGD